MLTREQLDEMERLAKAVKVLRIADDVLELVAEVRRQRDALERVGCANGDTAWLEEWIDREAGKQ